MRGVKNKTAKYFVALVLEGEALAEIERLKHELYERFQLKGALRSPAHITLHRPFEWREDREMQLINTLEAFEFGPALDLQIRDFAFFEPRVIYAALEKNEALEQLHQHLAQHCRRNLQLLNETEDLRGFHPHITIAFRDLKKPLFYTLKQEFESRKLKADVHFREISLLKLDKRWEVLKNFKKTGNPAV